MALNENGAWKFMMDFTEATASHTITTTANCGRFSMSSDTATTQVLIEGAGDDEDKDGIQNVYDRCPSGIGESDGWRSTPTTDGDQDGCRDDDEDDDDDNDGIIDQHDLALNPTAGSARHQLTMITMVAMTQMKTKTMTTMASTMG